jgi:putative ABC transport system substrate-binding protein
MRRRDFITLVGGGAALWPLAARAQHAGNVPRIGYLSSNSEDEQQARVYRAAFREALDALGWADGHTIRIDDRYSAITLERARLFAADLIGMGPSVLLATNSLCADALRRETRIIPIVFTNVSDPLGSGLLDSMSHPGGNMTGFTNFEFQIAGKWLDLLKNMTPSMTRAIIIMSPGNVGSQGLLRGMEAVAQNLGVRTVAAPVLDASQIESAIDAFVQEPNGGLIVAPGFVGLNNRDAILALAARHHLPAIYTDRSFIASGGLMSYDTDIADLFRRAASYVSRILRGEKPGDLPVQAPTKYSLKINLKAARMLGLSVPQTLLLAADEVIE